MQSEAETRNDLIRIDLTKAKFFDVCRYGSTKITSANRVLAWMVHHIATL